MTAEDVLTMHRDTFNRALVEQNFDALSRLYAEDYLLARQDGTVLRKAEVLHDLMKGGLRFSSVDLLDPKVRIDGAIAALTGEGRSVSSRNGEQTSARFRLVAIYVQSEEALELVYFQSTTIRD